VLTAVQTTSILEKAAVKERRKAWKVCSFKKKFSERSVKFRVEPEISQLVTLVAVETIGRKASTVYVQMQILCHRGLCCLVAGVPGQWLFHTSDPLCEGSQTSYDFQCRRWYVQEKQKPFQSHHWSPLPACPCWLWQSFWDMRYVIDWSTLCATHFWGVGTSTQVICVHI